MRHGTLFIIRGKPGSGKTGLGRAISPASNVSADDWFYALAREQGKTYQEVWDPIHLETAHNWCFTAVENYMIARAYTFISVANVFEKVEHIQPYVDLAKKHGYRVSIVEMKNEFKNDHGVPQEKVDSITLEPYIHMEDTCV